MLRNWAKRRQQRKAEKQGGTGSQRKAPGKKASPGIPSLTVFPLKASGKACSLFTLLLVYPGGLSASPYRFLDELKKKKKKATSQENKTTPRTFFSPRKRSLEVGEGRPHRTPNQALMNLTCYCSYVRALSSIICYISTTPPRYNLTLVALSTTQREALKKLENLGEYRHLKQGFDRPKGISTRSDGVQGWYLSILLSRSHT